MKENQLPIKRNLPKIEDLYGDIELASKYNDLSKLLNCPPKPEWVKINPMAGNSKYLPIEVVEYLLTTIFTKWRVEVKSIQVIANSVVAAVRLYVLDPITGDWDWQEGVGASPIQTDKGAAATDFTKVKSAAVQMAAPAAESYALKDAAEKFGKLFGKDLNRKDEINYQPMQDRKFQDVLSGDIPEAVKGQIEFASDAEALTEIYRENKQLHSNPKFMQALNARKNDLKTLLNGSLAN